uniref:Addiction module killer protein n=1 Tax=uncultured Elusimicrobia bacterium TaxID=699876 RepID=A0A650EP38_9BACT|nr:hypothetical protein Elusimicrob1349_1140 [uncultured Elusimicrobia bacterium]
MKEIVFFTINGKSPFIEWRDSLDRLTASRVRSAINRMEHGNFGDWKIISPGLCEMRLFFAGGLRIYYTERNGQIIILLCGGDKKTQSKDIAKAKRYLTLLGGSYD